MIRGWILGITVALVCVACSDPDEGPPPAPGITMVAGTNQSDTVLTTFVQALVVDVVTPQGIAEGIVVRFDANLIDDEPAVLVAPVGESDFASSTSLTTDGRGRTSVRIRLGAIAGPAEVLISVPEFGYSAIATYTVRPGLAFTLIVAPQDTIVEVGASFLSQSQVIDRHGNPADEPVMLTQPSSNLAVQGSEITATGPGRGTVSVRAGALTDILRVFIGPLSRVTGLTARTLVHFEMNRTVAGDIPISQSGAPYTADWSPSGQMMVADDLGGGPLRLIFPNGMALSLGNASQDWPLYPEFSPDGQWVYYSRSDQGWHIRRMRPDGAEDEAVPFIPGNHAAPSLSPDGTRMAVVNLTPDRIEIADLTSLALSEIATEAHSPAWSPDGERLALVNTTTRRIELISPDGTGRRVVSPAGRRFALGIDWTQDGMFILAYDTDLKSIVALDPESGTALEYQAPGIGAPAARPY
jgi:hypothetical protein